MIPGDYPKRSGLFGHLLPDLMAFDLREDLSRLESPTLVLYGDHEVSATLAGPVLRDTIPDAALVVLEDCGHFPFIEQPAAFSQAIRAFMRP